MLSLVRAALVGHGPFRVPRSPQRLLRRTKEFLEAELRRPIKLVEIGRMVGASPTYLTHLFRAVEGIPLHRYLTQLRLARALVELPPPATSPHSPWTSASAATATSRRVSVAPSGSPRRRSAVGSDVPRIRWR